jgi:hypothetical protein
LTLSALGLRFFFGLASGVFIIWRVGFPQIEPKGFADNNARHAQAIAKKAHLHDAFDFNSSVLFWFSGARLWLIFVLGD